MTSMLSIRQNISKYSDSITAIPEPFPNTLYENENKNHCPYMINLHQHINPDIYNPEPASNIHI